MKLVTFTALLLMMLAPCLRAQNTRMFTADKELSSSLINCIVQDKEGMIWVATENGLNRYDGAKFKHYVHQKGNPHSLCNNFINTVYVDSHGRIFVGTHNGLQMYRPEWDDFTVPVLLENGRPLIANITTITELKNGELWASGHSMLRLSFENDTLSCVKEINEASFPVGIGGLFIDGKERMWMSKGFHGLFCYEGGKIQKHLNNIKDVSSTAFYIDHDGQLIIGTREHGLLKYAPSSRDFTPLKESSGHPVQFMAPAPDGNIYIGTDGNGLLIYDKQKSCLLPVNLGNTPLDASTLKIHAILTDNEGNLWLGVYQKGVMMIPKKRYPFQYIGAKAHAHNFIGSNAITALTHDHQGNIWVGTDNDGIYKLSPQGQFLAHLTAQSHGAPHIVLKLLTDTQGRVWYGAYAGNMGWIDPSSLQCHTLSLVEHSGRHSSVYDLALDSKQQLWIATLGEGLFKLNTASSTHIEPVSMSPNINKWINTLHIDDKNKLYIGTYRGAYSLEANDKELPYKHLFNDKIVYAIQADKHNNMWMGTSEGLMRVTAKGQAVRVIDQPIYAIEIDDQDQLWLGTNHGLIQYNHTTGQQALFLASDGLQGNEFCRNASMKDTHGNIWMGGMNGITRFNPKEIKNDTAHWSLRLCDFYVNNEPQNAGSTSGSHIIMSEPVFQASRFDLVQNDATFTLEFASEELDMDIQNITLSYRLNQGEWKYMPLGTNTLTFQELEAGNYQLQVKGIYNNSPSDIKTITLCIHPAWWNTWWAYLIYTLLFLVVAATILMLNISRWRQKQHIAQFAKEEEEKEAKLQFLINLSHELRTPLSLIVSPTENMLEHEGTEQSRRSNYKLILKNAKRILNLVNQILDVRRIEKGHFELIYRKADAVACIGEVCDMFKADAEKHGINITFTHRGMEHLDMYIDVEGLNKIMFNLLSNAIKFIDGGKEIEVTLTTAGEQAIISVQDDGKGIDDYNKKHIFKRFYQAGKATGSAIGTGIGLNLVQLLVHLMHGEITVHDRADALRGTCFVVKIPIGLEQLAALGEQGLPERAESKKYKEHTDTSSDVTLASESTREFSMPTQGRKKTKYRIYIAEDDEDLKQYLVKELSEWFYVTTFENGKLALEQMLKQPPQLLITDVMMPVMDGITLCRTIKEHINLNHIPVIMLTAKSREVDNIEGLNVGADAYITKPFSLDILKHTIKNLIESHHRLENTFGGRQEAKASIEAPKVQSPDEKLMSRVERIITENLSNPDITIKEIAIEVGISPVHLNRKLKELTNQTTSRYIRNIRLKVAAEMLQEKKHSITEVADLTGFSDATYFSRTFKDLYGMHPNAYRDSFTNKVPKGEENKQ